LAGLIPKFIREKKEIYVKILREVCGAIIIVLGAHLVWRAF